MKEKKDATIRPPWLESQSWESQSSASPPVKETSMVTINLRCVHTPHHPLHGRYTGYKMHLERIFEKEDRPKDSTS